MVEQGRVEDIHAAAEVAVVRVGSSKVTPVLVSIILALVGGFGARILSQQDTTSGDIAQMKSDIRDINTRLDAGVIGQVVTNTKRLDDHERRLQALERKVQP
jgi:hypothetical protein